MSSKILIVAEHDGGKLNASTAKAVTCASKIAGAGDRERLEREVMETVDRQLGPIGRPSRRRVRPLSWSVSR